MPREALLFSVDMPRFQQLKQVRFPAIQRTGLIQPFLKKAELIIILKHDIIMKF